MNKNIVLLVTVAPFYDIFDVIWWKNEIKKFYEDFLRKDDFSRNWFWHLSLLLFVFFQHFFTAIILTVCENWPFFIEILWKIWIFETFQTILYF